jgi:hypothetical protein
MDSGLQFLWNLMMLTIVLMVFAIGIRNRHSIAMWMNDNTSDPLKRSIYLKRVIEDSETLIASRHGSRRRKKLLQRRIEDAQEELQDLEEEKPRVCTEEK